MDEQGAIELCLKHRDPVGFEFLVQKYRREAFFHAMGLLANQEDALDACQDAFAKAFQAMPGLERLPQFYPWFYSILRNHCLNLIARRETSARYREEQAGLQSGICERATPGDALAQKEEERQTLAALAALKAEYREILGLKYMQDHSYEEIAALLGIPRGTVMSRLYHARIALREAFLAMDKAKLNRKEEFST